MKQFLRVAVVMVFTVLTVFTGVTIAQEDQQEASGGTGFRVTPTRDQLSIEAGQVETSTINVRNVTNTTQTARAVVDDFRQADDELGGVVPLIGDEIVEDAPYSIKPFISNIDDFELQPGEEKEVTVTVSISPDAAPGAYYGLVRFVTVNAQGVVAEDSAGVSLNASVGVVYLIEVPGDTIDVLNLEEVFVTKDGNESSLFSSAPDTVVVRLKNDGNTFQAPFGKVRIKNWSGDVVHEYEINPEPRGNVLPDSIRRFENEIEGVGSFGRFTVETNISYGNGGNIITAETTFWVIPWTQIGLGIVVLVGLAFFGTRGIKSYNRRVIESSKGSRVKKK